MSLAFVFCAVLSGCAADSTSEDSNIDDPVDDELSASRALKSARIQFHYSNFYTLTSPNGASCAGDVKTYFDPIATVTASDSTLSPEPLTASEFFPGETIRPSFIKNVSVDMTDANSLSTANKAYGCSVGNGSSSPPVSSCATFDYSSLGGISSSLSGSLIFIGGVEGIGNSSLAAPSTVSCGPIDSSGSYTSCGSQMYALGVNRLPASVFQSSPELFPAYIGTDGPTGPVSTWSKLSGVNGYTGPSATAGAAAAFDSVLQKILLFGGAAPLSGMTSESGGVTSYETWVYDLKQQKWNTFADNVNVATQLNRLFDTQLDIRSPGASPTNPGVAPTSVQVPKTSGSRALFGYVATPGMAMAIDAMTTNGTMTAALIDKTDRLMIVGGVTADGVQSNTLRFNPTYGPDILDGMGTTGGISLGLATTNGLDAVSGAAALQWVDSYHTQSLNNSYGISFDPANAVAPEYLYTSKSSLHRPNLSPLSTGSTGGDRLFNGGYAPLVNNTTSGTAGIQGTGYLVTAGGFDASNNRNIALAHATNVKLGVCSHDGNNSGAGGLPSLMCGGTLSILSRHYSGTDPWNREANTASWSVIANFVDVFRTPNAPTLWTQIPEDTNAGGPTNNNQTVPWVGGSTLLPGLSLENNELVYFGGFNCRNYVNDSTAICNTNASNHATSPGLNPGRYWRFSTNSTTDNPAVQTMVPAHVAWHASSDPAPTRAGMAAARGFDSSGNVLVVAWGGAANGPANTLSTDTFDYLYDDGGDPRWVHVNDSGSSQKPSQLINASLVYSHVTGKFYLFGGYDPSSGLSRDETWELTVSGAAPTYTFSWSELSPSCYPTSCPQARRSHRVAEANYFNRNPGGTVVGAGYGTGGQQPCTAGAPCSYGIFMEGGTPDGFNYLGDRWMFDPTANQGQGHWQRMQEMPPRVLAAMASTSYTVQPGNTSASRAILFGGETALHTPPQNTGSSSYFVAPTLGDTWMYDYGGNSWNRAQLLGKGYNGAANIPTDSEFERRQSYDASNPSSAVAWGAGGESMGLHLSELSPPPVSGGIMITRTMSPLGKLAIPEVYLFGGRTKDGNFLPLDHVYKFCSGSTGEAFAYDSSTGISAPNPDDYSCDAYDADKNPYSPSPVAGFVGRWLRKDPDGVSNGAFIGGSAAASRTTLANIGAFQGAGAYDSIRDRIVLFGGWSPSISNTAVTDSGNVQAQNVIYEYTPPQPELTTATPVSTTPREGRWSYVPTCTGSSASPVTYSAPTARYGHTLAYDSLTRKIVLVGGYDSTGAALTQTQDHPASGSSYERPQVWTATYYSAAVTAENNTTEPGVDIGTPGAAGCYHWSEVTEFGNSISIPSELPPMTGLGNSASIYIPSVGYNTGYYTLLDNACEKAGPISSSDPTQNKQMAGGVYIDIDRTQLDSQENLLLNLTYMPLATNNLRPDGQTFTAAESAVFKIHLIRTGLSSDTIQQSIQPRHMTFADPDLFPQVARSISVMAPATGQVAQEQVLIPLSSDPTIDRIRIERFTGSGILLDATVFRLGTK